MPLASYDYDYYEYVNGHRTDKTKYSTQPASKRTATSQARRTTTSSQVRKTTSAVRTQTKMTPSAPKKNVTSTRKKSTNVTTTKKAATKKVTTRKTSPRTTSKKTAVQRKRYDIDIPIKTSNKITNKPKEMTLKKPKAKVNPVIALKEALIKTFGIVVFFGIAFAICYRYSLINEEFIALRNVKKEYETLQNVNEQLEADIESKTDLSYIENYAKYQLGMQKPSDSQIRYINIEKKDRVLTPVTIEEETNTNWFTSLCKEIGKILD